MVERHRIALDAREERHLIDGPHAGLRLYLRRLSAEAPVRGAPVLFVHGATFPSALAAACRLAGRSWCDALADAGFDTWALDFYGFGGADRYPEMDAPADANGPLCLAADAVGQLGAAVRLCSGGRAPPGSRSSPIVGDRCRRDCSPRRIPR